MILFKQVRAFSRGRYAAQLVYELHGEERTRNGRASISLLASRRMRRQNIRTMSKNVVNERTFVGGVVNVSPLLCRPICCDMLLFAF